MNIESTVNMIDPGAWTVSAIARGTNITSTSAVAVGIGANTRVTRTTSMTARVLKTGGNPNEEGEALKPLSLINKRTNSTPQISVLNAQRLDTWPRTAPARIGPGPVV